LSGVARGAEGAAVWRGRQKWGLKGIRRIATFLETAKLQSSRTLIADATPVHATTVIIVVHNRTKIAL